MLNPMASEYFFSCDTHVARDCLDEHVRVVYVHTCLKQSLKRISKIVFKIDCRLMQVKGIAKCPCRMPQGSILQYFRPALSYNLP